MNATVLAKRHVAKEGEATHEIRRMQYRIVCMPDPRVFFRDAMGQLWSEAGDCPPEGYEPA